MPRSPKAPKHPLAVAFSRIREEEDLDQKEVAAAAGVSKSKISATEKSTTPPKREEVEGWVAQMGVPLQALEWEERNVRAYRLKLESWRRGAPSGLDARELAAEWGQAVEGWAQPALERLGDAVEALVARRIAPSLWARLRLRSPGVRREMIRSDPSFHSPALVELLGEESVQAAARSADEALEIAELARFVAGHLKGAPRAEAEGYSWGFVANARRVKGNLNDADEAFRSSDRLWEEGRAGGSRWLSEARLWELKASLRTDQDRLEEAKELLDRAFAQARMGAERARILINKAWISECQEEYESALRDLQQAEAQLPRSGEPRLRFLARFNRIVCLIYAGRYEEAVRELPFVQEMAMRLAQSLDLLRLRWMEGRSAAGLGRLAEGIGVLEQVRQEFVRLENAQDTARISLELAALYAQQGRQDRVKALAAQVAVLATTQRLSRPALAAVNLFCKAAEGEKVTAQLLWDLAAQLRRAVMRREPANG